MTDRLFLKLYEPEQAHQAIIHAWNTVKPLISDGKRLTLEVKPEKRSSSNSAHFHGLIGQISAFMGGDLANPEDAKRILISAFKIETINDPDLKPEWDKFGDFRVGLGLHGETVLLGNQSRDFSPKLARSFITWLYAFGVEHKIPIRAYGEQER
jgi:hypothetical protein